MSFVDEKLEQYAKHQLDGYVLLGDLGKQLAPFQNPAEKEAAVANPENVDRLLITVRKLRLFIKSVQETKLVVEAVAGAVRSPTAIDVARYGIEPLAASLLDPDSPVSDVIKSTGVSYMEKLDGLVRAINTVTHGMHLSETSWHHSLPPNPELKDVLQKGRDNMSAKIIADQFSDKVTGLGKAGGSTAGFSC